jgi:hypothetical protein
MRLGNINLYQDYMHSFITIKLITFKKKTTAMKVMILNNISLVYLEMQILKKATYIFEYLLSKNENLKDLSNLRSNIE